MTRILLRSGKDPFTVVPPELALELAPQGLWARNTGNMIFTDAMHRTLSVPGADVVSNGLVSERTRTGRDYAARVDDEFDHFVVPLANAFRASFMGSLDRLTRVIERLTIPVTVVGVGVAGGTGSLDQPLPQLSADHTATVQRFVRAVLDRSATIGVRGEFTREYLAGLGFGDEHVDVVGCPSLYRDGADLHITKKVEHLDRDAPVALNLSPYVKLMGPVSLRHAERYPHLTYIPQGHDTLALMLWGTEPRKVRTPSLPTHRRHPLYQSNRMRFFVDSTTWIQFLATQEFSFGTRIHGNIAALLACTPAVVIAHDSRTLELARFHQIPHRLLPAVDRDVDAADLHAWADYAPFNAAHASNAAGFARFLERNGLAHIHAPGQANPDYDARLAATPFPPPVETLMTDDPAAREAATARVALLREVAGEDVFARRFRLQQPVPARRPRKVEAGRGDAGRAPDAAVVDARGAGTSARPGVAGRVEAVARRARQRVVREWRGRRA